jgi:hypothetical protein
VKRHAEHIKKADSIVEKSAYSSVGQLNSEQINRNSVLKEKFKAPATSIDDKIRNLTQLSTRRSGVPLKTSKVLPQFSQSNPNEAVQTSESLMQTVHSTVNIGLSSGIN